MKSSWTRKQRRLCAATCREWCSGAFERDDRPNRVTSLRAHQCDRSEALGLDLPARGCSGGMLTRPAGCSETRHGTCFKEYHQLSQRSSAHSPTSPVCQVAGAACAVPCNGRRHDGAANAAVAGRPHHQPGHPRRRDRAVSRSIHRRGRRQVRQPRVGS